MIASYSCKIAGVCFNKLGAVLLHRGGERRGKGGEKKKGRGGGKGEEPWGKGEEPRRKGGKFEFCNKRKTLG